MELQSTSFGIEGLPRITLNEYFMGIAIISAKQSAKGCYPVGACIVNNDQTIVATGYNTLHKGWNKTKDVRFLFVSHAEVAAILNKTSKNLKGCTMYVTKFPCDRCANIITSSEIKEIIYCDFERDSYTKKKNIQAVKKLFAANDIIYKECTTIYNKLVPKAYDKYSRLKKEECFMGIAYLTSKQSKNVEKIGACIVNDDNIIVGIGYNEFSKEMGQISINSFQNNIPVLYFKDCTIYVTSFPGNESAKVITWSGIKTVIYLHKNTDDKTEAAKKIFDTYSVKYIQYNLAISNIEIFKSASTLNMTTKVTKEKQKLGHKKVIKKKRTKKNKRKRKTTNKVKSEITTEMNTTVEVIENEQINTTNKVKSEIPIEMNETVEVIENEQINTVNKVKSEIPTEMNTTVEVIENEQMNTTNNPDGFLQTVFRIICCW